MPGSRFALLVHRGLRLEGGVFPSRELVDAVPTVSAEVAWIVGHTLVSLDNRRRPPQVYVDWQGGPLHGIYPDTVWITGHGCTCGVVTHTYRDPVVVAEMTPVLRWVNQHTTPVDWCELVPVAPADMA